MTVLELDVPYIDRVTICLDQINKHTADKRGSGILPLAYLKPNFFREEEKGQSIFETREIFWTPTF